MAFSSPNARSDNAVPSEPPPPYELHQSYPLYEEDVDLPQYEEPPTNNRSGWEYHRRNGTISYWARNFTLDGHEYAQYGLSGRRSATRGTECFFTCRMMPRGNNHNTEIEECCKWLIMTLGEHRSHGTECFCDFRSQCAESPDQPSGYGDTQYWIKLHDRLCSCACFDFDKGQKALPTHTSVEDWEHRRVDLLRSYWTRKVLEDGVEHIQYGISSSDRDAGPDCSFTCKMTSNVPALNPRITLCCLWVATALQNHRDSSPSCSCIFNYQCSSTSAKSSSAEVVRLWMRNHDAFCSCGCFDNVWKRDNRS